ALMTCIAYAYLQHLRLAEHRRTGRGKNADPPVGTAPAAQPTRGAPRHRSPVVRALCKAHPMSALQAQVPAHA
ncbi:MAG: IS701 family transposase, partial [Janthinobacterium lividum]